MISDTRAVRSACGQIRAAAKTLFDSSDSGAVTTTKNELLGIPSGTILSSMSSLRKEEDHSKHSDLDVSEQLLASAISDLVPLTTWNEAGTRSKRFQN